MQDLVHNVLIPVQAHKMIAACTALQFDKSSKLVKPELKACWGIAGVSILWSWIFTIF